MIDQTKFDIDYQFDFYLKQVKLEKDKMPADQLKETKQAFIAGISSMMVMNTEIGKMEYAESAPIISKLWSQLSDFWTKTISIDPTNN